MKYTTLAGHHREQSVLLSRCAETTGQRRDYPEAQRRVLGSRNDRIRDHTWRLSHIQSELRDTTRMTACAVLLAWLSLMLCTVPLTPRFHLYLWPQSFRMAADSDLCQSACQRGIPSVLHSLERVSIWCIRSPSSGSQS